MAYCVEEDVCESSEIKWIYSTKYLQWLGEKTAAGNLATTLVTLFTTVVTLTQYLRQYPYTSILDRCLHLLRKHL